MNTKSAAREPDDSERHLPRTAGSALHRRGRRWAALLDRIAAGDVDALATLYDESSSLAFGLIVHILQDTDAAEDALADVYLQVRHQAGRDARERNPVSWLMELARRAALARLRRAGHVSRPVHVPPVPSAAATSVTPFEPFHRERQRIRRALDQLTPRQRSIVQMTYFGGLSGNDVADELRIPTGQVMSDIRRAMATLRSSLACVDGD